MFRFDLFKSSSSLVKTRDCSTLVAESFRGSCRDEDWFRVSSFEGERIRANVVLNDARSSKLFSPSSELSVDPSRLRVSRSSRVRTDPNSTSPGGKVLNLNEYPSNESCSSLLFVEPTGDFDLVVGFTRRFKFTITAGFNHTRLCAVLTLKWGLTSPWSSPPSRELDSRPARVKYRF